MITTSKPQTPESFGLPETAIQAIQQVLARPSKERLASTP